MPPTPPPAKSAMPVSGSLRVPMRIVFVVVARWPTDGFEVEPEPPGAPGVQAAIASAQPRRKSVAVRSRGRRGIIVLPSGTARLLLLDLDVRNSDVLLRHRHLPAWGGAHRHGRDLVQHVDALR